jgi:hypothetical protein
MEAMLRELIDINREILAELRLIRQGLTQPQAPTFTDQSEEPRVAAQLRPAPARMSPQDLEDIRGSLMDGIKRRNADKSDAFSEFEKLHKKR